MFIYLSKFIIYTNAFSSIIDFEQQFIWCTNGGKPPRTFIISALNTTTGYDHHQSISSLRIDSMETFGPGSPTKREEGSVNPLSPEPPLVRNQYP